MKRTVSDVTQRPDGNWQSKVRGAERASVVTPNKQETVQKAASIEKNRGDSSLVIHGRDGKIQSERTYGNDPYPPKG